MKWSVRNEVKDEICKIFAIVSHGEVGAGIPDGRYNFGTGTNNAFILHQPINISICKPGDFFRVKAFESAPETLPTAKDYEPGQAGLKAFQNQSFP